MMLFEILLLDILLCNNAGSHRQLRGSPPECFGCDLSGHAVHFEKNAPGAYREHVVIHGPLATTECDFRRFSRYGLVGKYTNPYLSTSLDVMGDGATSRFYLACSYPMRFLRLEAEAPKRKFRSSGLNSAASSFKPFSVFYFFGLQHTLNDQKTVNSEQDRRYHCSLFTAHCSFLLLSFSNTSPV